MMNKLIAVKLCEEIQRSSGECLADGVMCWFVFFKLYKPFSIVWKDEYQGEAWYEISDEKKYSYLASVSADDLRRSWEDYNNEELRGR